LSALSLGSVKPRLPFVGCLSDTSLVLDDLYLFLLLRTTEMTLQNSAVDKPPKHEKWQRIYAGLRGVFLRKTGFVNSTKM
jgi:hypothetical protein